MLRSWHLPKLLKYETAALSEWETCCFVYKMISSSVKSWSVVFRHLEKMSTDDIKKIWAKWTEKLWPKRMLQKQKSSWKQSICLINPLSYYSLILKLCDIFQLRRFALRLIHDDATHKAAIPFSLIVFLASSDTVRCQSKRQERRRVRKSHFSSNFFSYFSVIFSLPFYQSLVFTFHR